MRAAVIVVALIAIGLGSALITFAVVHPGHPFPNTQHVSPTPYPTRR